MESSEAICSNQSPTNSQKKEFLCQYCKNQADSGRIPVCNKCKGNFADGRKRTVAMMLARNGIKVPLCHDKFQVDICKKTVEMKLAQQGIEADLDWQCDVETVDKDGNNSGMLFAYNGHKAPDRFRNRPDIKNRFGETLEDLEKLHVHEQ